MLAPNPEIGIADAFVAEVLSERGRSLLGDKDSALIKSPFAEKAGDLKSEVGNASGFRARRLVTSAGFFGDETSASRLIDGYRATTLHRLRHRACRCHRRPSMEQTSAFRRPMT